MLEWLLCICIEGDVCACGEVNMSTPRRLEIFPDCKTGVPVLAACLLQAAPEAAAAQQTDIIKKYSRDDAAAMSGMLTGITDGLKKAIWKVYE